jgi:hypothetical protein
MKDDVKNDVKEENLSGTPLEFPKVDLSQDPRDCNCICSTCDRVCGGGQQ